MARCDFGVPRPVHPVWREHACVSQDLLSCVGHGWIAIKPNVKALQNNLDVQKELGLLKISIDVKKYADLSLVKDAAKRR